MGRTLENLSRRNIGKKSIFNNRFVIELCESTHIHYRNLRIVQRLDDFISTAESFVSALERWKKRGCPGTGEGVHIELCRKNVAITDESDEVVINLNDNLYKKNEGGIFAEGANFSADDKYIHVKLRDLRLEMSVEEFREVASAFTEAATKLENSDSSTVLQAS